MSKDKRIEDNNRTRTDMVWKMTCWSLEKRYPSKGKIQWRKELELRELSETAAAVVYKGALPLDLFREEMGDAVAECLCWAADGDIKVEFVKEEVPEPVLEEKSGGPASDRESPDAALKLVLAEKSEAEGKSAAAEFPKKEPDEKIKSEPSRSKKQKTGGRRLHFACLAGILIAVCAAFFCLAYLPNRQFEETFYQIGCGKLENGLRIIQLSDLNGSAYGEGNKDLLRRVKLLKPDLIVMTGDMVGENRDREETVIELCGSLTAAAPVCYVYGENEGNQFLDESDELRSALEEKGVQVLWDEAVTVEIKGNQIDIFGLLSSGPSALTEEAAEEYQAFLASDPGHVKLLLSHTPYVMGELGQKDWADLTLCGHTLGGGINLPKLGALYEEEYGFLPAKKKGAYVAGRYSSEDSVLIVSRGLANTGIVRMGNQPELVIIDMLKY